MQAKGAMAPAQRFLLILFLLVALHTRVAWAAPWQPRGADEGDGNGYPAYPLDLGLHPLGLPAGLPREKYPAEGGEESPEPSEVLRDILKEQKGGYDAVREEIPAVPKTKSTAKIINAQDLQMNWIIGTAIALAFVLYTTVVCSIVILQRWWKKMRDASAVSEARLEVGGCSGTTERWTQRQQSPLPPASPVAPPPSQEPLLPTSLSPASLDQQENPSSPVRPQTPPKEPPCHTTPLHQEPFPAAQSPLGAGAAPQTYPLGQLPLEAQDPAAPAEGMCSGGSSRTPHTPRGGRPDHQPQCPASGLLPRLAQLWKRLARGVSWFLPRRKRRSRRQPRSKASHRAVKRESGKKRKPRGPGERRSGRQTKGPRKQ